MHGDDALTWGNNTDEEMQPERFERHVPRCFGRKGNRTCLQRHRAGASRRSGNRFAIHGVRMVWFGFLAGLGHGLRGDIRRAPHD